MSLEIFSGFPRILDILKARNRYISNIEMPGGTIRYVPLHPPKDGATRTSPASEWTIDFQELENTINSKTRMIVLNSPHNPVGKVFSREELQRIGDLCVKHNLIILSDEVYDRLFYVPFTRIGTLSPELYERTLTVGSAGKAFYATGWRVGYLIGPEHLIKYVAGAHTRICYSSVSPLQEAAAVAFEQADKVGFWDESRNEMKQKMERFCEVFDELGIPVCALSCPWHCLSNRHRYLTCMHSVLRSGGRILRAGQHGFGEAPDRLPLPASCSQSASRFQALLVPHPRGWRGCRSANGVLHRCQLPHRGGLSPLCSLQER